MIKSYLLTPFAFVLILALLFPSKVDAQQPTSNLTLCNSNPCLAGFCFNSSDGLSYNCDCFSGFQGPNCDQVIANPCQSDPCFSGQCINSNDTFDYQCQCNSGWSGQQCDTVTDACLSSPCWAGECISISNGSQYLCVCDSGYTGSQCQERIADGCQSQPCWAGTCQPIGERNFSCNCIKGFIGQLCSERDTSEFPCASNPCLAGTCSSREFSNGKMYVCQCPPFYTGQYCETVSNIHPCTSNDCLFGSCQATSNVLFKCNCYYGFTGSKCDQADITLSPCYESPCKHDGICSDQGNNYTCTCNGRYTGRNCDDYISNYCYDNPCGNRGICLDVGDRYRCICNAGYKGEQCQDLTTVAPTTVSTTAATEPICGGVYTQQTAVIQSPNYPGNYPSELNCSYQIIANRNQTIQLEWEDFELEEEILTLCYDKLTVYDGIMKNSNKISESCGTSLPKNIHSSGHILTLHFQTDSFLGYQGFKIRYAIVNASRSACFGNPCQNGGSCVEASNNYTCNCINGYRGENCQTYVATTLPTTAPFCGAYFTDDNGTITTSNYPQNYDSNSQCVYNIEIDNGSRLQLDWLDFRVEGSPNQCYDRVEVFDGGLNGKQLLNSTCGNQLPERIISSGAMMTIAFYSDQSINYKGFKATYVSIH